MRVYLEQKGYCYSLPTLHKYMNSELGLKSIVRRVVVKLFCNTCG